MLRAIVNRYILSETIKRFQEILAEEISEEERAYTVREIASMQRQLALLDAELLGAQKYPGQIGQASAVDSRLFRRLIEDSNDALLIIDPRPGLRIVDMTAAFEAVTLTKRRGALGENLFHVFPDNPDRPDADGVSNVLNAFREAADSGEQQATEGQRYDVQNADGQYVERYWRPVYIPILNEQGVLTWLLVRLEDVTSNFADNLTRVSAANAR